MTEDNVKANSGAADEKTVDLSKKLDDIYTPPSGKDAEKQTSTEEQGKGQESKEDVSGEDKKQEILTEAKVSEIVSREVTKGLQRFQSMSDKSEARVKELIKDSEARTKLTIGRDLTDKEKTVLEGSVREEVLNSPEGDVDAEKSDTFIPSDKAKREFAARVQELELEYRTRLYDDDEELKTVNFSQPDHLKVLEEIESALKAKAGKGQSDKDSVSGAKGRLPLLQIGSSPDAMKNMTPGDLLRKAFPIPGQDK